MMDPVNERQENEARFLAWDVPADVQIIGLVHPSWLSVGEAERNASAADTSATAVARRREHTLLTSCETSNAPLDNLLGGGDRHGLNAALHGRVRLSDIALRSENKPYVYLPAGQEPVDLAALFASEAFRQFVERVRGRGGTLLLHMPEDALADESLSGLLDGYLTLGDIYTRPVPPTRAVELGRLVLDAVDEDPDARSPGAVTDALAEDEVQLEDAVRADDAAETEDAEQDGQEPVEAGSGLAGAWRRHRSRGTLPVGRIAIGIIAVIIIAGGWWFLARETIESSDPDSTAAVPDDPAAGGPGAEPTAGADAGTGQGSLRLQQLVAIVDASQELGYSVAMASSPDPAEAEAVLNGLRATDDRLYYIAPTPVRGDTYFRVLAGAVADQAAGQALMDALVSEGLKRSATAWDVRPVPLVFRLGVYPDRARAESALAEASAAGIPAYILSAGSGADSAFQLLSGGYGSETAAETMQAILQEAGRDAELVARRGTLR
jgi:cell division septation protein DedD